MKKYKYNCNYCMKIHQIFNNNCDLIIQINKYLQYKIEDLNNELMPKIKSSNIITKTIFKCEKCDKYFKSKKNLIYHSGQNVCTKHNIINNKYNCIVCNKQYTYLRSLKYHQQNKNCNINSTINTINKNENIINKKIANENKSNNIINMINNNTIINNTTNNISIHINDLVPFRFTNYDIDSSKLVDFFNNPYTAIEKIIKHIHFNIQKPQNMNILHTNRRDNSVKIYDNNSDDVLEWQTKNKDMVFEFMFGKSRNTLEKIPNKLKQIKTNIDETKLFKLQAHLAEIDYNKKTKKEYIKLITNITYDKHMIVLDNKHKLDLH